LNPIKIDDDIDFIDKQRFFIHQYEWMQGKIKLFIELLTSELKNPIHRLLKNCVKWSDPQNILKC
jgi:hypothetical protein